MSTLNIRCYSSLAKAADGSYMPVANEGDLASGQDVTFSASVGTSTVFPAGTRLIRIHADADARINIGADPDDPAGGDMIVSANAAEYHGVPEGSKLKVVALA